MLKIFWKRGEIAPQEQFLLLSTIFCYLMSDFYIERGIRFSLRDKRLFEITEVEITRVDCKPHTENLKTCISFSTTLILHRMTAFRLNEEHLKPRDKLSNLLVKKTQF